MEYAFISIILFILFVSIRTYIFGKKKNKIVYDKKQITQSQKVKKDSLFNIESKKDKINRILKSETTRSFWEVSADVELEYWNKMFN